MTNKERYHYRRANNLCVNCGDKSDGHAYCEDCRQIIRIKYKDRWDKRSEEEKQAKREYHREYRKEYLRRKPEKAALYKSRRSEYNRRYRNGYSK